MIRIPPELKDLLSRDRESEANGLAALSHAEEWFYSGSPEFFPEYTDHGEKHLERVLENISALIADSAWTVLSPKDVCLLIAAVVLHDAALYLSFDGFLSLVQSKATVSENESEDASWAHLWRDYLVEAVRFDTDTLEAIFGGQAPIRVPPTDLAALDYRDRLLIGEFIRRHHARLAEQFAVAGIPGYRQQEQILSHFSHQERELAGLIARSHGQPLRRAADYLRQRYLHREFRGVHPVFLMALLRLADFLDIAQARAPAIAWRMRRVTSPISRAEWRMHHAVLDLQLNHEDPETVFLLAKPRNTLSHLRLTDWLLGFQRELDESWAVLGEIYGRDRRLSELRLQYRRVRSNLDDLDTFTSSTGFVPGGARLRAASGQLIRLLVEPLYEDRPGIGVRELLQNALDAVHESLFVKAQNEEPAEKGPRIVVSLEKDEHGALWLTVADTGLGMSVEVIRDYYLNIGASFRESNYWRRTFLSPKGRSEIIRSGRFGIGVLAAFLLGEEVHVSTRHMSKLDGIEFVTRPSETLIELKRCTRSVGTTVAVRLKAGVFEALAWGPPRRDRDLDFYQRRGGIRWTSTRKGKEHGSWDWYCLSDPALERRVFGAEVPQRYRLPSEGSKLPPAWRRLSTEQYADVQWSFEETPAIICNGLVIGESAEESSEPAGDTLGTEKQFEIRTPSLSVFDRDGYLPLNLRRTDIIRDLPFVDELLDAVLADFLCWCVLEGPSNCPLGTKQGWYTSCDYRGISAGNPWAYSNQGFLPNLPALIQSCGALSIVEVPAIRLRKAWLDPPDVRLPDNTVAVAVREVYGRDGLYDYVRRALGDVSEYAEPAKRIRQLLIDRTLAASLRRRKDVPRPSERGRLRRLEISKRFEIWTMGTLQPSHFLEAVARKRSAPALLAQRAVAHAPRSSASLGCVSSTWLEIVGSRAIPYEWASRKRELRKAFDILIEFARRCGTNHALLTALNGSRSSRLTGLFGDRAEC